MVVLASLAGFVLYIVYIWVMWSNQSDDHETKLTFKERIYLERQELVVTFIGALLFMWQGEGMIDSVCDGVNTFFGEKYEDLCTSIQVNMEELSYVIGGASFGSVGIWGIKFLRKRAKKKLENKKRC